MDTVNAKTAVTLVCLGFVLLAVSMPLYLGKIKMNNVYGFRIRKAMESEDNWYRINRFGAQTMICWSFVIMAVGIVCLYIEPHSVLSVANLAFLSLLVPIVLTLAYARRF
jgi:hypothetical protein